MLTALTRGLGLFLGCLTIHVLIWRLRPIRKQGLALILLFVLAPGLVLLGGFIRAWTMQALVQDSWLFWGLAYLLHAALSGAYFFLYTGVTGFSPTLAIMDNLAKGMPGGIERSQLAPRWFTDERLSGARHANLLSGGLIHQTSGMLHLTARGRFIAGVFLFFRRFLGLSDLAKG
jgi:hypothetical protein